nr:hypothetical protein [Tanacetum cinerariifolium]
MDKLENHLIIGKLHENDCKTALTALRTMLEKIFNSELLKFSNFNFKNYTGLETQPFKDAMISDMDFIEKYLLETILHELEIQKLLTFIDSQFSLDYDSQMIDKYFVEYIRIEVKHFRDTLLQHTGQQHAEQREFNNEGRVDWKRILKKKTKTRPKPNTEWKRSEKTKSFEAKKQKSTPEKSKVNPGKVKVKPDKSEAEK